MTNNVLSINGQKLPYTFDSQTAQFSDITEDLLGLKHGVRFQHSANNRFSSFPPVKIAEGFYLALGDNRDRSADSRVIGLIPRSEIVGRSSSVILSLNYDNYYLPRQDRFFKAL